jgi:hypothetical protein
MVGLHLTPLPAPPAYTGSDKSAIFYRFERCFSGSMGGGVK